jgi:hypothetical protein
VVCEVGFGGKSLGILQNFVGYIHKVLLSYSKALFHRFGGNDWSLTLLGEILMFPIFICWAYWLLILPFLAKNYFVFIGVGACCLFLTWKGYQIVKGHWNTVLICLKLAYI